MKAFPGFVRLASLCGLTIALTAGAADSDKPRDATPQSDPNNPALWNTDRMMEDAVVTISRRYNLNPEQEEFTRKLLVKRTKDFLKSYEGDLRQLLVESIQLKLGQMAATPENYKSWAVRARPVFEAATKAILEGNREWGEILTEEQKRIHRADLDQMDQSFEQLRRTIDTWSAGNFKESDLVPQPPTLTGRDTGRVSTNPPQYQRKPEDFWEIYVRQFVMIHKFTDDQKNSAYAVLSEVRNRASAYRDSHKKEFNQAEAAIRAAAAGSLEQGKQREALTELERPIREQFADLCRRLDEMPTREQREAVTEAQRTTLDRLARDQLPAEAAKSKPEPVKPAAEKPAPPATTTSAPAGSGGGSRKAA